MRVVGVGASGSASDDAAIGSGGPGSRARPRNDRFGLQLEARVLVPGHDVQGRLGLQGCRHRFGLRLDGLDGLGRVGCRRLFVELRGDHGGVGLDRRGLRGQGLFGGLRPPARLRAPRQREPRPPGPRRLGEHRRGDLVRLLLRLVHEPVGTDEPTDGRGRLLRLERRGFGSVRPGARRRRPRIVRDVAIRLGLCREVGGRPQVDAEVARDVVIGQVALGDAGDRGGARGREALGEVVHARDRDAAAASAGVVVPAADARVLAAVDAEVERLVEGVELRRRQRAFLGAHRVVQRVAERVLAGQVVLQPANEPPRLAQRVQAGRRAELVARPAAFAEGFSQGLSQCRSSPPGWRATKYTDAYPSGPHPPIGVCRTGRSYPAC